MYNKYLASLLTDGIRIQFKMKHLRRFFFDPNVVSIKYIWATFWIYVLVPYAYTEYFVIIKINFLIGAYINTYYISMSFIFILNKKLNKNK